MAEVIQTSSGSFASSGLIGMQIEKPLISIFVRLVGLPLLMFGLVMASVGTYFVFTEYLPKIGEAVGAWDTIEALFVAIVAIFMFLAFAAIFGFVGFEFVTLTKPDTGLTVMAFLFLIAAAIGSWTGPMQDNSGGIAGFLVLLYAIAIGGSYFLVTLRNLRLRYDGNEMVARHIREDEAKALVKRYGHLVGNPSLDASSNDRRSAV